MHTARSSKDAARVNHAQAKATVTDQPAGVRSHSHPRTTASDAVFARALKLCTNCCSNLLVGCGAASSMHSLAAAAIQIITQAPHCIARRQRARAVHRNPKILNPACEQCCTQRICSERSGMHSPASAMVSTAPSLHVRRAAKSWRDCYAKREGYFLAFCRKERPPALRNDYFCRRSHGSLRPASHRALHSASAS